MALSWTYHFLCSQFLVKFPYPTHDFSDQTIVVTGSNVGLGLEAARHIARLGASKVILAVRTVSKGETAADDIARSCNIPRSRLQVWQLDMGNVDSIEAFAERTKTLDRLDGVILNAGVMSNEWSQTAGIESHLAINVLGSLLLGNLLLPIMDSSAASTGLRGRLTFVGSDMMYIADRKQIDVPGSIIERLNDKTHEAETPARYPLSKLLLFYSVNGLAQHHPLGAQSGVIVSTMTPGACQSELFRDGKSLPMHIAWSIIARSTEIGGRTLVYAISPELPVEYHGKFIMDNKVTPWRQVLDDKQDERLAQKWNSELQQYLEKVVPGCTQA